MDAIRSLMRRAREARDEGCSLCMRPVHTPPGSGRRQAPPGTEEGMSGMPGGPGGPGPGGPGDPGGPGGPPPGPKEDPNERMFCADTLPQLADCLGFTGRKKLNHKAAPRSVSGVSSFLSKCTIPHLFFDILHNGFWMYSAIIKS